MHSIKQEHITPLWVTIHHSSHVHQIDVEIDTGAACNIMPNDLYKRIFGSVQPEVSNARIRAYGNNPHNRWKHSASFEITGHNGHPIIGRDTSKQIGYIHNPDVHTPPPRLLENQPTMHDIKALRHQVKLPVIQEKRITHVIIDSIRHPLPTTKDYITGIRRSW
jgi:hypothetical protein